MVANVRIMRWIGPAASPNKVDVTGINSASQTLDDHTTLTDSSEPIEVPPVGNNNYSFWVTHKLYVQSMGGSTQLLAIRWYTDGTNNFGTGISWDAAQANTYVQANGVIGRTGAQLNLANHSGLLAAPTDAFTFTMLSPMAISGTCSSVGDCGNEFIVTQVKIESFANIGSTPKVNLYWSYEEV